MIPVSEPLVGETEISNVLECLRTGWISSAGRYIEEFESRWAAYCGMSHGVAVSNGTVALEVAVRCLDLEPGDEVILPAFTIISCVQAVIYAGGVPVLVDSDPRTWTMDVGQIESKITKKTRAIMPVHIYGHPVDMEPVWALARKYNLRIVEDAAEAHGAECHGRKCGGLGDISCFSFYANKIITTGEGGMVLTKSEAYAEKARSLRNLCFRSDRRFLHTELGHNYRLTNLQAAIGAAQVGKIEELVQLKRTMAAGYTSGLRDCPGLTLPVEEPWARNVYWMYGLVLDESLGFNARALADRLRARGVETRPFFLPMNVQPALHDLGLFTDNEPFPVAERLGEYGLYLPSSLGLTAGETEFVCQAVRSEVANAPLTR
jgi:perosamine synthetase